MSFFKKLFNVQQPKLEFSPEDMFKAALKFSNTDPERAFHYLITAADNNHISSQLLLAYIFHDAQEHEKAFYFYYKAASLGHRDAQFAVGVRYCIGMGVPKNKETALEWYAKAAEQGHIDAQFSLGRLYYERMRNEKGNKSSPNRYLSIKWLQAAATQGHAIALRFLKLLDNRTPADRKEMELLEKAANAGDIEAQFSLGLKYERFTVLLNHYEIAAMWYNKAAERGHINAQVCLAQLHDQYVEGVLGNHNIAIYWYQEAAKRGDDFAQYRLGTIYENGEGVPISQRTAAGWYQKAAEQGYTDAQFRLAEMYAKGQGVSQNAEQAEIWYRKAATQGHTKAQNCLKD